MDDPPARLSRGHNKGRGGGRQRGKAKGGRGGGGGYQGVRGRGRRGPRLEDLQSNHAKYAAYDEDKLREANDAPVSTSHRPATKDPDRDFAALVEQAAASGIGDSSRFRFKDEFDWGAVAKTAASGEDGLFDPAVLVSLMGELPMCARLGVAADMYADPMQWVDVDGGKWGALVEDECPGGTVGGGGKVGGEKEVGEGREHICVETPGNPGESVDEALHVADDVYAAAPPAAAAAAPDDELDDLLRGGERRHKSGVEREIGDGGEDDEEDDEEDEDDSDDSDLDALLGLK